MIHAPPFLGTRQTKSSLRGVDVLHRYSSKGARAHQRAGAETSKADTEEDRLARARTAESNAKKLEGGDGLWRVRTGDFRIVYTIQDEELLVVIVTVGNRKDIYDGLRRAGLID